MLHQPLRPRERTVGQHSQVEHSCQQYVVRCFYSTQTNVQFPSRVKCSSIPPVPSIKFWSLWNKKQIIGCGALKILEKEHGEFKSIRVHDDFRKKGYGTKIIENLIDKARGLNIKRLSIETGAGQFFKPARKLFEKCQFQPCKPFAHYKDDKNSIYLTKLIDHN